MVNPSGVGPLILDDEEPSPTWSVQQSPLPLGLSLTHPPTPPPGSLPHPHRTAAACCLPTPLPISAPTGPAAGPAQPNSPYIGGVNPMLSLNGVTPMGVNPMLTQNGTILSSPYLTASNPYLAPIKPLSCRI